MEHQWTLGGGRVTELANADQHLGELGRAQRLFGRCSTARDRRRVPGCYAGCGIAAGRGLTVVAFVLWLTLLNRGSGGLAQGHRDAGAQQADLGIQSGTTGADLCNRWPLVQAPFAATNPLEVLDRVGQINRAAVRCPACFVFSPPKLNGYGLAAAME